MNVHSLSEPIPPSLRRAVLAIGNFDGVHRGHHVLIEVARKRALNLGYPFAVLTFEPHPKRVFRPGDPPFRITPASVKFDRLSACLVDHVLTIPFSTEFAALSAAYFIDEILKNRLHASYIVVGNDFHFGHNREGTIATLREAGFSLTTVDPVRDATGAPYSSTRIRSALTRGQMDDANGLLGWEWYIESPVVRGDQRGRELGYPTANMALGETLHPAYGIYASETQIADEREDAPWRPSVTNIGTRPMFEVKTALAETHLFDFDGDLYGRTLRVRPLLKLRDEMRFADLDGLVAQMGDDCLIARAFLQNR